MRCRSLFVVLALAVLGHCATTVAQPAPPPRTQSLRCRVLVAGGSTASLATALTAATLLANATSSNDGTIPVCFTDPTDWPGGQLTASAVSAIDFGQLNRLPVNQPRTLRELISSQPGNPGACWVSYTCYLPQDVVGAWIMPRIAALNSSLLFLPRTTIRAAQRSADGQRVTVVTAVQRVPREGVDEWVTPLSAALPDWYSPQASPHFHKTTLTITADVVVEATEFGDVLATAGLPFAQGVEAPTETSPPLDTCGQAVTLPFFLRLVPPGQPVPPPPPAPVPPTPPEAAQPPFSLQGYSWERVWTYRRALLGNTSRASGGGIFDAVTDGDVSQQNWGQGNDYAAGYIFLPAAQAQAAAAAGQWAGGLNLTALRQAEERAIGWARWYVAAQTDAGVRARLALDTRSSGTSTGLPKMPYLRDTRRGFGADGFVLNSSALAGDGQTGTRFADTVALANYPLDVHSVARSVCAMPAYIATGPGKPFYIPFRALAARGATNVLLAGKTIAQSFYVNAATREHPTEWTTGVAAGAAAALMVQRGWSDTAQVAAAYDDLAAALRGAAVQQPLEWTFPAAHPQVARS